MPVMWNIAKPPCDEAVILADSASPYSTNRLRVLTVAILGSSMVFIDGTVVNVALPALQSALHATISDVQWVVESYALLLSALLLTGGSLGDLYSRRKVFAAGVILFSVASAWCGISPNVSQLIAARALQGVGGALLVPGSLALISASFSSEERGQCHRNVVWFYVDHSGDRPATGRMVRAACILALGILHQSAIALTVLLIVWRIPECGTRNEAQRIDWPGAMLTAIGLGELCTPLLNRPLSLVSSALSRWLHSWWSKPGRRRQCFQLDCSLAELSRREPAHILFVFRFERSTVFLPVEPNPSSGIHGNASGRGAVPLHPPHVPAVAVDGWALPTLRSQDAPSHRPYRGSNWLRVISQTGHRRFILDHIFSSRPRAGTGHGDQRSTAYHDGNERRRS